METDPYAQSFPDYDTGDAGYSEGAGVTTERRKHGRRGKITTEGNRKACARYRSKNRGRYRAVRREYMKQWRATKKLEQG